MTIRVGEICRQPPRVRYRLTAGFATSICSQLKYCIGIITRGDGDAEHRRVEARRQHSFDFCGRQQKVKRIALNEEDRRPGKGDGDNFCIPLACFAAKDGLIEIVRALRTVNR